MAEGLNRVMLLGNLGADPELRTAQSGTAILKLRLATTERYLDANKTWQERTEWHSVTVFGKRAEALSRFLTKGSTIFVEGGLRTSSYDKDGVKTYRTDVVASNVILAGGKRDGGETQERPRREQRSYGPSAGEPAGGAYDDYGPPGGDDDIPFASRCDATMDLIADPRRRMRRA